MANLALMRLAAYHRARGDEVTFSRSPVRQFGEPDYDRVYGSAIFAFSAERVRRLQAEFPGAIIGGTWNPADPMTVEGVIADIGNDLDYSIYPGFTASLGFTSRGCRFRCGFCVVPRKEGRPTANMSIAEIWRGPSWPRHLHLLDNDFFGQPEAAWRARIAEIREGGFKVCFNQGVNLRTISPETAAALASVGYYDDQFAVRRLYTAWDNLGDERRFMRGVDMLADHGILPRHLLAYMLVGYDRRETWESVLYRFERMAARGIRPYPMVYGERHRTLPVGGAAAALWRKTLADFQRWAIRRFYTVTPFAGYDSRVRIRAAPA